LQGGGSSKCNYQCTALQKTLRGTAAVEEFEHVQAEIDIDLTFAHWCRQMTYGVRQFRRWREATENKRNPPPKATLPTEQLVRFAKKAQEEGDGLRFFAKTTGVSYEALRSKIKTVDEKKFNPKRKHDVCTYAEKMEYLKQ
jgi:hypothetical protein